MTVNTDKAFAAFLKGWSTKHCGPKPGHNELVAGMALKAYPNLRGRVAGAEAFSLAMGLRPDGYTMRQFMVAAGSGPAHNCRRKAERTDKLVKVTGGKADGETVYTLTLTPKGESHVKAFTEALTAAANEPAPKAKRKAKKAKRKAKGAVPEVTTAETTAQAETPASEPAPATEGHTDAPQA